MADSRENDDSRQLSEPNGQRRRSLRTEYDIKDLKFRVGQIEQTLVHHSLRFDRLESRLDLIQKRLGLVDA